MSVILQCIANGLRWDVTAILFAALLWPAFRALLPEGLAWGGARLVSPLLIAWAALLPAVIRRPTPFTPTVVALAALGLGLIAWGLWGRTAIPSDRKRWFRFALSFEKAHLLFLLLACCYVPFIDSLLSMGERFRDSGILNALLTQRIFPLEEPWFSGFTIQYYTFGYYVPSTLGLFSGQDTLFVYNLIIAWTFATYGAAGWLLFRAIGLRQRACLFGAAVIALGSNAASLLQAVETIFTKHTYDWWAVSRVLLNTITEFPLWTASLGDLHPHYLTMPLFPLLLAWTASEFYGKTADDEIGGRRLWRYGLVSALLMAWIWGSNTWELPVSLSVVMIAVWWGARNLRWEQRLRVSLGTMVASVAFAFVFLANMPKANKTWALVHNRSTAVEILLMWGLFLVPIFAESILRLRSRIQSDWLIGGACLLGLSLALQSGTLLLVVVLALVLCASYYEEGRGSFSSLLAIGGLGLVLLCEIIHLEDIFGDGMERLNTVFKFYIPAWAMLAAAAALCALELAKHLSRRTAGLALAGWMVLLSGHLLLGLSARTGSFAVIDPLEGYGLWSRFEPDDARLMRWAREQVLAKRLSGTILEAAGGAYQNFGRVMTAAGLPGYYAWEGYGGMLQTLGANPALAHRSEMVKTIYNGMSFAGDCAKLQTTLHNEKIAYVVIGSLERKAYDPGGIALLQRCLPVVDQEGNSALLAARPVEPSAESLARGQR